MDANVKHCIINIGWGGWYAKGTERLEKSLNFHGFNGDFIGFKDKLPPNCPKDFGTPYNLKAYLLEYAISLGYTHILWLDCSVWAISDPNKMFDIINSEGWYFWRSGYNCAQTCSDKCLDYFDVTRDHAEGIEDCSSSIFGLNLNNELAARFANDFIKAMKDGAFEGSREHDGQSNDPRFMFHRQDQSAASLLIDRHGLTMYDPGKYTCYYTEKPNDSIIFQMRGM